MAYAGKVGQARFQPPVLAESGEPRAVGAVAAGLAIGLVFGAGLALLFAPLDGHDARRMIRRRMRRVRSHGRDAWLDLRDELRRAAVRMRRARRRRAAARSPTAE